MTFSFPLNKNKTCDIIHYHGGLMMYQDIYNKIKEMDTIIIHRHSRPDGDALGSQLGLKEAILATFPNKCVFVVGDETERLKWVGNMDNISDQTYNNALVIVVDCGADKLISDERYKNGKCLIKIDHHIPQGEYGDIVLVDTSFESCAGIIADIVINTPMVLNNKAATLLFLGIVTDSGRFRYSSTSTRTFEIVSKLYSYNIDSEYIYSKIYTEKLANVKLRAELVSKFEITSYGVAYLINTKEDIEKYNIGIFDISRGMVNIMAGIEEVKIWVNFCEDISGDIYVEIRSNGLNINQVAVKFNGGGHLQASGCTIKDKAQIWDVIEELNKVIEEDNNV